MAECSGAVFGFQNAPSLQFPLKQGTKECRISPGTIQAGEEQMVAAPISGSCSGRLIVSHLLSPRAIFSSPASAPTVCFGFSSSFFPSHPPTRDLPFSSWSLLSSRTSSSFFTFCSRAPPRLPAPQQPREAGEPPSLALSQVRLDLRALGTCSGCRCHFSLCGVGLDGL